MRQYGRPQAQSVALHAYAEASHLDGFSLHAGDTQGVLRGTRLDEVQIAHRERTCSSFPDALTTRATVTTS